MRSCRSGRGFLLRLLQIAAAIVGLGVSPAARAAVFRRDWKTPGDGLLTYDDVNRREWLDLSQTLLAQFPGGNREAKYQAVVGHLNSGGLFSGFVVAKAIDVTQLAKSSGIDILTLNFATNAEPVTSLGELLGFTAEFSTGSRFAIGVLEEISSPPFIDRVGAIFLHDVLSGSAGQAGLRVTSQSEALASNSAGVMLYRTVPEPSSLALQVVALWWLRKTRRKR